MGSRVPVNGCKHARPDLDLALHEHRDLPRPSSVIQTKTSPLFIETSFCPVQSSFLHDPREMLQYHIRYRILAKDRADQGKGDPDRLIPNVALEEHQEINGTERFLDRGPEFHA